MNKEQRFQESILNILNFLTYVTTTLDTPHLIFLESKLLLSWCFKFLIIK